MAEPTEEEEVKKFSELDPAGTLTGAEVVPVVQAGINKKATTEQIKEMVLEALKDGITLRTEEGEEATFRMILVSPGNFSFTFD